jgi:hypothetical protein
MLLDPRDWSRARWDVTGCAPPSRALTRPRYGRHGGLVPSALPVHRRLDARGRPAGAHARAARPRRGRQAPGRDSGDEPASRAPAAAARAVGKQIAAGLARAYCEDLTFEVDRRYEPLHGRFSRPAWSSVAGSRRTKVDPQALRPRSGPGAERPHPARYHPARLSVSGASQGSSTLSDDQSPGSGSVSKRTTLYEGG